jgi:hypothetical protein
MVEQILENRLVSVILYGSILFDDLAPGYGDLDFLAVLKGNLTEAEESLLNRAAPAPANRLAPFGLSADSLVERGTAFLEK